MSLVLLFLFSGTTILNNLKYCVCVILIAIFLEDLFVATVIQYEGAKRYMKSPSEGKAERFGNGFIWLIIISLLGHILSCPNLSCILSFQAFTAQLTDCTDIRNRTARSLSLKLCLNRHNVRKRPSLSQSCLNSARLFWYCTDYMQWEMKELNKIWYRWWPYRIQKALLFSFEAAVPFLLQNLRKEKLNTFMRCVTINCVRTFLEIHGCEWTFLVDNI